MQETELLALLLSDRQHRLQLKQRPEQFRRQLGLDEVLFAFACQIDPDQLETQAQALVAKRFREAGCCLPNTLRSGAEDYRELFQEYASSNWPQGHDRHMRDALSFADHLRRHKKHHDCRERNRLAFCLNARRFQICSIWSRRPLTVGVHVLFQRHAFRRDWHFQLSMPVFRR